MTTRALARGVLKHYKKWWLAYVIAGSSLLWFGAHYKVAVNVTDSLPGHVYLVVKGELPTGRNEPVAFRWLDVEKQTQFPTGVTFLKLTAGLPGDVVRREGGAIHVGDRSVEPKEFSKKGRRLAPNEFSGSIPEGFYFVAGTHKDSLDSRYAMVGLIPKERIIGRAYELF